MNQIIKYLSTILVIFVASQSASEGYQIKQIKNWVMITTDNKQFCGASGSTYTDKELEALTVDQFITWAEAVAKGIHPKNHPFISISYFASHNVMGIVLLSGSLNLNVSQKSEVRLVFDNNIEIFIKGETPKQIFIPDSEYTVHQAIAFPQGEFIRKISPLMKKHNSVEVFVKNVSLGFVKLAGFTKVFNAVNNCGSGNYIDLYDPF